MKVYKFFKIPHENEKDDIDIERRYPLYAITNKKKYAERFKEDRNMKKFICKVHEDVSKDEYAEMCNEDRGAVLFVRSLTTIFDDIRITQNKVESDVLMTYWEKQLLDEPNTLLDDENTWMLMPFPMIFKSKYIKALNDLQYITYYKLMSAEWLPCNLMNKFPVDDDDYSAPSILYDEVALFIDIIKDTL